MKQKALTEGAIENLVKEAKGGMEGRKHEKRDIQIMKNVFKMI